MNNFLFGPGGLMEPDNTRLPEVVSPERPFQPWSPEWVLDGVLDYAINYHCRRAHLWRDNLNTFPTRRLRTPVQSTVRASLEELVNPRFP